MGCLQLACAMHEFIGINCDNALKDVGGFTSFRAWDPSVLTGFKFQFFRDSRLGFRV